MSQGKGFSDVSLIPVLLLNKTFQKGVVALSAAAAPRETGRELSLAINLPESPDTILTPGVRLVSSADWLEIFQCLSVVSPVASPEAVILSALESFLADSGRTTPGISTSISKIEQKVIERKSLDTLSDELSFWPGKVFIVFPPKQLLFAALQSYFIILSQCRRLVLFGPAINSEAHHSELTLSKR
jgi:hypothetical protein